MVAEVEKNVDIVKNVSKILLQIREIFKMKKLTKLLYQIKNCVRVCVRAITH